MPVDRAARDRFIDTIASHMRGEIDGVEAVSRLDTLAQSAGDNVDEARMLLDMYAAACDRFGPCGLEWPESWENTRRLLALLMTDKPFPRPHDWALPEDPWARVRKQRLARSLLASLVLSAATIPWLGPVPLIASWLLTAAVWFGASFEHHRPDEKLRYWPFETAEEWRASESLIERLALPAWERSVHYRPPAVPPRLATRLLHWGSMPFAMVMLFWIVACTWPIVIWVEAFPREKQHPGPAAA